MEAVSQWQPEHVRQLWNSGSVFPGWLNEDLRDVGSQANANCGRWSHCLPIIFDPAGLQHWAPRMEDRIEMFGRLYANFINCLISCRSALSEWSRLSQLNEAAERLQKRIFEATSPIFMNLQKSGRPLKPHFSDPDSMKALEGKDFDDTMLDDMFEIIAGGRTECGPAAEAGPAASSPAEPQQPAWVANIPSATLTELKLIACIANPDAFPADLESAVTTLQATACRWLCTGGSLTDPALTDTRLQRVQVGPPRKGSEAPSGCRCPQGVHRLRRQEGERVLGFQRPSG